MAMPERTEDPTDVSKNGRKRLLVPCPAWGVTNSDALVEHDGTKRVLVPNFQNWHPVCNRCIVGHW